MKIKYYRWFYIPLVLIATIITGCYSEHEVKRVVELVIVQDLDDTNKISGYSGTVIPEGDSAKLKALAVFHDGSVDDVTEQVTWTSSDPDIAEVNKQGWVRAQVGQSGEVRIMASQDRVNVSHIITVTDAVLASIELVPHEIILNKGEQERLRAKGTYTDGSIRDLDSNDGVIWKSSHPAIASVDHIGLVTALELSETKAQISASLGDIESSNTTKVTVLDRSLSQIKVLPEHVILPRLTSTQLNVIGVYSDGTQSNITDQVDWKEEDSSIARVSTSGELEGLKDGHTSVTATSKINSELMAVSRVEVTDASLLSIQITPATVELPVGFMHQLTAIGEFNDGVNRDITSSVLWASSDELKAEVSSSGELTAKGIGAADITATLDGITSNTSQLIVNSSVLEQIDLTPLDIQLPVNQSTTVTAQGLMSDGNVINISNLAAWHSTDPSIVSVDDFGYITGISDGNAQISVYLDDIESTAPLTVTVIEATLESIFLTSHAEVNIGMGEQLEAIGVYSDGSAFDITGKVQWTSNDHLVATVNNTGVVSGISEGVTKIEASYGEIDSLNHTEVSVLPVALIDIKITSDSGSDTIVAGYDQTYKATGVFSDGTEKPLPGSDVFWLSSDVEVATVSSSGEVKGVTVGTTVITALKGDIASSEPVTITVTEAELVSISVEAQDNDIPMGLSTQVTAKGEFSDGSVVAPLSNVVWSSSNENATVDQSGLVTGVSSGSTDIVALRDDIQGTVGIRILDKILVEIEINPFSFNGDPANDGWLPNRMSYVQLTVDYIYSDGSRELAPASNLHWYHTDSATGFELISDGKARSSTSYQNLNRTVRVVDHQSNLATSKSVRTGNLSPEGKREEHPICGKLGHDYNDIPSNECVSVLSVNVLDVNSSLVMAPLNRILMNEYDLSADSYVVGAMPDGGDAAGYFTGSSSKINSLCEKMNEIELYGFNSWGGITSPAGAPVQSNYDALFDAQGDMTGKWPSIGYYAYSATQQYLYYRTVTGASSLTYLDDFIDRPYFVGCSVTPFPSMRSN